MTDDQEGVEVFGLAGAVVAVSSQSLIKISLYRSINLVKKCWISILIPCWKYLGGNQKVTEHEKSKSFDIHQHTDEGQEHLGDWGNHELQDEEPGESKDYHKGYHVVYDVLTVFFHHCFRGLNADEPEYEGRVAGWYQVNIQEDIQCQIVRQFLGNFVNFFAFEHIENETKPKIQE